MSLVHPAYQPVVYDLAAWIQLGALVVAWAVVTGGLTTISLLLLARRGWLR